MHKLVEAGLLLQDIDRPRRIGLERQVEALVPAVLLGVPRRAALEANPEVSYAWLAPS